MMPLDADHIAAVRAAVAAHDDELLELTRALIGCRTDSQSVHNPEFPAEAERCQDLVAAWLLETGAEVERWLEPPRYPVVAGKITGSGGGRSLAFNGHIDVVPPGNAQDWTHQAWSGAIADGRMWGRGAADMKGGVACFLVAMRALRASGLPLAGDIWAHVVADEEVVGYSTRHLIDRVPEVDAVLVAEPTDLTIMPVEGGLVHLRIEVEGRESHAGNRFMSIHAGGIGHRAGINAIEKAFRIADALRDLEREWANLRHHPMLPAGFNSIMPGIISGGPGGGADGQITMVSNPGTSPNYCSLEYNIWYLPSETFDSIREEIEAHVLTACQLDPWLRAHPPRFTWKLRNIFFPPAETPPDHPFIQDLAQSLVAQEQPIHIEGFNAASELAWYAEHNIAGAIFGPGRIAQAHGPNEYVEIEQLRQASTVMALTAAAWCSTTN